jgi:hypothetical protein
VFKTPGKLRGKTPRTARKRDVLEQRQPLSDVFASNVQAGPTPAKTTTFYEKVTQFQIAEDGEHTVSQQRPLSRSKSPQRLGKPGNTDSGYHGMTEDEMEADTQTDRDTVPSQSLEAHTVSPRENQLQPQRLKDETDENEPASDGSFISAKEAVSYNASKEALYPDLDEDNATVPDDNMELDAPETVEQGSEDLGIEDAEAEAEANEPEQGEAEPTEQELHAEMSHEPSETSSPAQPLARKSSFTFSSLPAREPLTAKRSIGGRNSHMDAMNRNSVFAKSVGKSFGFTLDDDQEDSPEKESQGKTSAQLLHERISMLGKAKDSRSSKSIPQALYPQLPPTDAEDEVVSEDAPAPPPKDASAIVDDEDDDWIAPSKPTQQKNPLPFKNENPAEIAPSTRPTMHKKAISTTDIPSPIRPTMPTTNYHSKSQSVVLTGIPPDLVSTTPAGSPASKKQTEPMSASKKLWGAFKSARSLFASSAGSSAAAKLEAHDSPAGKKPKKGEAAEEARKAGVVKMPGALWSESQLSQDSSRPMSVISGSPSRKTRSSTESDKKQRKEMKAQQKAADELEKAREKERAKANKAQEEKFKAEQAEMERSERERKLQEEAAEAASKPDERPRTAEEEKDREDMPPPPPPKGLLPPGKLRAPTRPVRPTREAAATKAKPAPVNIRVASQLQRLGQPSSQDSFTSNSSQGSQGPPPPPKTGLRPASAQSNPRSSTMPQNNSRVRALEAAARKKEQEEREKQRKAEQKRELERKRAAKAEDERRIEQEKKAEEQRRMQEMKQAAQRQAEKQAAEAKRREQQRFEQQQQRIEQQRLEQQRLDQSAAAKAKAAHELAEAIQRERAEKQAPTRGDAPGTLRQLGQRTVPDLSARQIQPNPAKPPKRIFPQDDDEPVSQPSRPGMQRNPPSYQQNEAKRRKTDELEQETDQRHSVMAPPKRPSTMRKVSLIKQR